MIVEHLKTKRPKPVYAVSHNSPFIQGDNLSQTEYLVRDRLIAALAKDCPYRFGDIVRAWDEKDFKKEGLYKITGICSSWYAYKGSAKTDKEVEWPDSNNPKIVTAMCLKTQSIVEATTNYFRKASDEETKAANC